MGNNVVNIKKKKIPYFGSISFLIVVILITISLYLYNNSIIKANAKQENFISELNGTIKEVEKNENFKIFSLIEVNKDIIDGLFSRTNITKYINHLKSLEETYYINFRGFDLSNGDLDTMLLVDSDENGLAYKKMVNFVEDYRTREDALFDLNLINKVSGYDDIKINLNFEIK